jgi:phospholipase C
VDRREFLKRAGLVAGAVAAGGGLAACADGSSKDRSGKTPRIPKGSVLDRPAAHAPFDTVVIVMMENRSFDHLLGWTGSDAAYLDAGRRRYGRDFHIDGRNQLTYRDPQGAEVATHWLPGTDGEVAPYQGCGQIIPGHGWTAGRAQLEGGFLAPDSGNDAFAVGYYRAADMALFDRMVRRFTTYDRWFSSLLGPTFPNREYFHAATSDGAKHDPGPLRPGMFRMSTIWDLLRAANVPVAYYYTDLPLLPLWGRRFDAVTHPLEQYLEDCAAGRLANVVMVEPGFQLAQRTDDHPLGDVRTGQRWVRTVFDAFAKSKHWERGLFVLFYDEWGGFFDHVRPPTVKDERTSSFVQDDFGQLGFRVPAIVASPFARRGFADHELYEHASVLRMLEWRFLGAPAAGPKAAGGSRWWLTERDRNASNLAASLAVEGDADIGFDLDLDLPLGAAPCAFPGLGGPENGDPFANVSQSLADLQNSTFPPVSSQPWLNA